MKFREFIVENKEVHHVLAFGRMSPPTTGHEVLVNKVKDVADQHGAGHSIVLSHTNDRDKNPLTSEQKLKHAKRFFPGAKLSVSDKEAPNFLTQAAKLHKQGVTHLHFVAGSDRVPEYQKLLKKYNGTHEGALFNFKKITVHNAGERDPDAEGTAGMSASKMRAHAAGGNFKEFKKGIPGHVADAHAREMYNDVRKGMQVKEDLDSTFEELLVEGVHDESIFKAVFLAGGPGSGKDYVLDNTLAGHGLTEINSDKALEFLMDKKGLDKTMPAGEAEKRNEVRGAAKNITEIRQRLALLGRNGLIINGTGDDVEKIKKIKERLEGIGYDTSMLVVNTEDEVSKQRNIERGQRGGRTVPEEIRKEKWDNVQRGRPEFAKMFGQNYMEIDNSQDLRNATPDVVKAKKQEMLDIFKKVQTFVSTPPQNPAAEEWVAMELHKKDTLPVPKDGAESTAHPGAGAGEEAQKLGLSYYGFGRYGKNGQVTHRSVHGKLIEIQKEPQIEPNVPVNASSEKKPAKKVNEEFDSFLNESVTISITGDSAEEVHGMLSSLTVNAFEQESVVEYGLSDESEFLTLGKHVQPHGVKSENMVITNDDIQAMFEEKKHKLLKDKNGKTKVFMLRRGAAKEAHVNGGQVMVHPKGGYVIKIKEENEHDETHQELSIWKESRTVARSAKGSGTSLLTEDNSSGTYQSGNFNSTPAAQTIGIKSSEQGTGEAKTTKTISLSQIRAKQKENFQKESIDKGIEPGLSMATSGENMARGATKTKQNTKPLEEMQGDETTASIGDQKENELKRKGINLSSFKAKRPV